MKETKHYACNNSQICKKRIQPNVDCKKEKCIFCIETEIFIAEKKEKMSLEW